MSSSQVAGVADRNRLISAMALACLVLSSCGPVQEIVTPTQPVVAPITFDSDQTFLISPSSSWPVLLDDQTVYALDDQATLWGFSTPSGAVLFSVELVRSGDSEEGWICPVQLTDDSTLYTVAANHSKVGAPIEVTVAAIEKFRGVRLWDFSPPVTARVEAFDEQSTSFNPYWCSRLAIDYSLTLTAAGLLLTLKQSDGYLPLHDETSIMINATTGDVVWQTSGIVHTADGASVGINAQVIDDTVSVCIINLSNGKCGSKFVRAATEEGWTLPRFSVAGQIGGNLIVVREDTQTIPGPCPGGTANWLTIYQVDTNKRKLLRQQTTQVEEPGLSHCQLGDDHSLLCTPVWDTATAFSVSIDSGITLWQNQFQAEEECASAPPPVTLGGLLYGADHNNDSGLVIDISTGQIVSTGTWPKPLAVNEYGMVFVVDNDTRSKTHQYGWMPAGDSH